MTISNNKWSNLNGAYGPGMSSATLVSGQCSYLLMLYVLKTALFCWQRYPWKTGANHMYSWMQATAKGPYPQLTFDISVWAVINSISLSMLHQQLPWLTLDGTSHSHMEPRDRIPGLGWAYQKHWGTLSNYCFRTQMIILSEVSTFMDIHQWIYNDIQYVYIHIHRKVAQKYHSTGEARQERIILVASSFETMPGELFFSRMVLSPWLTIH